VCFTNASSILHILIVRFVHLSFLNSCWVAEQSFREGVVFSFNSIVLSLTYSDVEAFFGLLRDLLD